MTYRVEFTTAAARQVKKLRRQIRDRVLGEIENLAEDPRPHGAKNLVGEDTAWSIRVREYRVIYDIVDAEVTVIVVRAGHRRAVDGWPRPDSRSHAFGDGGRAGRSRPARHGLGRVTSPDSVRARSPDLVLVANLRPVRPQRLRSEARTGR